MAKKAKQSAPMQDIAPGKTLRMTSPGAADATSPFLYATVVTVAMAYVEYVYKIFSNHIDRR